MASRIVGGTKFMAALKRLPEASRVEVSRAIDESIELVRNTAIALAPSNTGRLKRALASRSAVGRTQKGMRVEFGFRTRGLAKKIFYAHFIEYGTKAYKPGDWRFKGTKKRGGAQYVKMRSNVPARPARPFMGPALDLNRMAIRRKLNAALKRAVRRAARG